jgi:hypothetical protein
MTNRDFHFSKSLRFLILVYAFLLPNFDGAINLGNTLFFALLLTLMVVLFDPYRQAHLRRFAESG